jgi:hypothetical protein
MRYGRTLALSLALPGTLAARQQESEVLGPPPLTLQGVPNSGYGSDLHARIQAMAPEDRKEFFRLVRRQQREIRRRIEEMEYTLGKVMDLKRSLERQGSPLVRETEALIATQKGLILQHKAIEKAIIRERAASDPHKMDPEPLATDLYAGIQFSSLYRDPENSSSFFSRSRPFVALDIRQVFRRPDQDHWMEGFGTLSFQSSSKETSDTVNVITTSGHFRGEMGLWWMQYLSENLSWGFIGSVGLVGFSEPETSSDLTTSNRDQFRNRARAGFTIRQEEGTLRGSVAEISYVRDPLFRFQDRLFIRGRVVLTSFGSVGSSGDFYIEGTVSKGRSGRDEAVLLLGLRLDTLSFLRGLGMRTKGE